MSLSQLAKLSLFNRVVQRLGVYPRQEQRPPQAAVHFCLTVWSQFFNNYPEDESKSWCWQKGADECLRLMKDHSPTYMPMSMERWRRLQQSKANVLKHKQAMREVVAHLRAAYNSGQGLFAQQQPRKLSWAWIRRHILARLCLRF